LLLFILEYTGDSDPSNVIHIDPGMQSYSAAYEAGLRSGDRIFSINDKKIESFEDIFTNVSLSTGEPLQIKFMRGTELKELNVTPRFLGKESRPTLGVEPAGERRVVATFTFSESLTQSLNNLIDREGRTKEYLYQNSPNEYKALMEKEAKEKSLRSRAIAYLNDGDILLKVNGVDVHSIYELQSELGKYQGQRVKLVVDRKKFPLLNPWTSSIQEVEIPVMGADVLEIEKLTHPKFKELDVDSLSLLSYDPDIANKLSNIQIDGNSFSDFSSLKSYIGKDKKIHNIIIGQMEFKGTIHDRPIGLLGFRPGMKFKPEPNPKNQNLGLSFVNAWRKVVQNISNTLTGLRMLFAGALSPKDSLSGPIGIVQYAGISLEYGWETYLDFVAKISLALMVMNLLPIPVADGGHLVLYGYEWIVGKPMPTQVIEAIFRIGFVFLLGLGIFVSFNDVLRLF
jgi:regulator of sigma E protease